MTTNVSDHLYNLTFDQINRFYASKRELLLKLLMDFGKMIVYSVKMTTKAYSMQMTAQVFDRQNIIRVKRLRSSICLNLVIGSLSKFLQNCLMESVHIWYKSCVRCVDCNEVLNLLICDWSPNLRSNMLKTWLPGSKCILLLQFLKEVVHNF